MSFNVNGGAGLGGIRAGWQRVEKRRTPDGIEWQNYAWHTWDASQMEMSNFLTLLALQGRVLTSLYTTGIDDTNTMTTYTSAEIIGVISGGQTGRRAVNVHIDFRVKVV